MNGSKVFRVLRFAAFGLLAVAIFGFLLMSLWNWLIPSLTGWHTLGFVQALGLLALCRILFGGFGGRWRHAGGRGWSRLSPEERERFRARFQGRCGWRGASEDQPAA
jgi:hypothetical protein